ncbi:hypothetical protein GGQ99_005065 [Aminobacter niigataensis]|uniref:Uncharacterized protein n=1 Tax=Aminobacter niigataensis TaxID=83265 RepID=A0ABR6LB95_9HYPH|nr:hypothetical protein [Aminobacter niigataensis]
MKNASPVPIPASFGAHSSIRRGLYGAHSSIPPSAHKGTISYISGGVRS